MLRKPIFLLSFALKLFLLGACVSSDPVVSSTQENNEDFWLTLPEPGRITVIGVSGPRSRQELEIAAAREDAARKISMLLGLEVSFESIQNIGSGFFDFYTDTDISLVYDMELIDRIEGLSFNPEGDLLRRGGSLCIRFSYPVYPGPLNFDSAGIYPENPGVRPPWISRPPAEIGGFTAGVGFARRQQRLSDTIMKATESAAAALVSQFSAHVTVREVTVDFTTTVFFHQESRGRLAHFLVLETWIDPVSQDVWILAIAEKAD